jgi:DNA repair exonuclease SbcCD ATPase subunit
VEFNVSTTKIEDQYEEALERLKEIGAEAGLEGLEPLLRSIDRFNGELRRKNAAARATAEQFEAQVREMQARLAERKGLAMEVETLAAKNRVLKKENGRLRDSLAGLEGQLAEQAQRVFKNADDMVAGASTFTKVKAKCLVCGLHFIVCTWSPDDHTAASLRCPECGQRSGRYIVWKEPGPGFIFQHVPGGAKLTEIVPAARR